MSILFTAIISGTPAALACDTASFVCGRTPSSAATTTMATKTTLMATRSTASPSTTATKMLPAFLLALLLEMLAGEGGGGFASFRLV